MINISEKKLIIPTTVELEDELSREKYKIKYKKTVKSTIYVLITVVAISVLVATLIFPVLQIYGKSMEPTLVSNDILLSVKKTKFKSGDIIAFYYNNRILVKRIIATSSEWVNIDSDGNVFVNDKLLDEPYIAKKAFGESDIKYPYQVPEEEYFILGDQRELSIDSRNSLIGTVAEEEIIGKVIFRLWPIKRFGLLN